MKLIGTCKDDINRCPIDYYSIGHVIFGFIAYLISYLIIIFCIPIPPREYALISCILMGIVWELFENNILIKTKLKAQGRQDSLNNSIFDILFVFFGGCICQILTLFDLAVLVIGTIVFLIASIILFENCGTLTINEKLEKKPES